MYKQVYDANGKHIGIFDGEYIYALSGQTLLRIDTDEVYNIELPCEYVGAFDGDQVTDLTGSILFRVED